MDKIFSIKTLEVCSLMPVKNDLTISKHKAVEGRYNGYYRVISYGYYKGGHNMTFGNKYRTLKDANLVAEYITKKGFPEALSTKAFNIIGIRGDEVCDRLISLAKSYFNNGR